MLKRAFKIQNCSTILSILGLFWAWVRAHISSHLRFVDELGRTVFGIAGRIDFGKILTTFISRPLVD